MSRSGQPRPQASRRDPVSFGKMLPVDGIPIWYDVHRNGLYEVDPVLADALPLLGRHNHREVAAVLAGRHAAAEIDRALAEIDRARAREGLFLTRRPRPALPPGDRWEQLAARGLGHLTLGLTEDCNLRCRYCPRTHAPTRRPAMEPATARRAVRYFAAHSGDASLRVVSLYGGEPLLELDLVRAVITETRRHEAGPPWRIVIDTNGALVDDEVADLVATAGLHLQISLDGPPRLHDRRRVDAQGRGTHDRISAGLRRILARDPGAADRLTFNATVTPPWDFVGLARYFADCPPLRACGVTRPAATRLNVVDTTGLPPLEDLADAPGTDCLGERIDDAAAHYLEAHRQGRREDLEPALAGLFDDGLIRYHHRPRGTLPEAGYPAGACLPGIRRLFVRSDGAFLPCERVDDDQVIGHVDRGLDPRAVRGLQRRLLDAVAQNCRDCWAVRLCRVCFTALNRHADDDRSALVCTAARDRLAADLRLYARLRSIPGALAFLPATRML